MDLLVQATAGLGIGLALFGAGLAWVVIGRRPVPGWASLGVLALALGLGGAVGQRRYLDSLLGAPSWELVAVLAPLHLAATLGALVRPGGPTGPWPPGRLVWFALTTTPLVLMPLLGRSSPLAAWIWVLTVGAAGLRLRGGSTARATSDTLSTLAVLLAGAGALLRPGELLLFGAALVHAAVVRWSLAPTSSRDRWSLVIGLGAPALVLALEQLPPLQTELAARWSGTWASIPTSAAAGRSRPRPLDCWPQAPAPGGTYRGCRDEVVRLVLEDHRVGDQVDPIVVRTGETWPPTARLGVLDLFREENAFTTNRVVMLGDERATLPGGRIVDLEEAISSVDHWWTVEPSVATWRELLLLCGDGRCSFPTHHEPDRAQFDERWRDQIGAAAKLLAFVALVAWVRRLTRDHGRVPSGWWPVAAFLAALPSDVVRGTWLPLFCMGAVSLGITLGAERYGPGPARSRWLALGSLFPLGLLGFAFPAAVGETLALVAAYAVGPALLAGRPALVRLRGELAASVTWVGGMYASLLLPGWSRPLRSMVPLQLTAVLCLVLLLGVIALPAAAACWRIGRRGLAAAVLLPIVASALAAGSLFVPNAAHRRLAALDASAPLPRSGERGGWTEASCAWTPNGTLDLRTGAPCANPELAVVPGGWPVERLDALPASVTLLLFRRPTAAPVTAWGSIDVDEWDPQDDSSEVVLAGSDWTMDQLVEACASRWRCVLARPGFAGVPQPRW